MPAPTPRAPVITPCFRTSPQNCSSGSTEPCARQFRACAANGVGRHAINSRHGQQQGRRRKMPTSSRLKRRAPREAAKVFEKVLNRGGTSGSRLRTISCRRGKHGVRLAWSEHDNREPLGGHWTLTIVHVDGGTRGGLRLLSRMSPTTPTMVNSRGSPSIFPNSTVWPIGF